MALFGASWRLLVNLVVRATGETKDVPFDGLWFQVFSCKKSEVMILLFQIFKTYS